MESITTKLLMYARKSNSTIQDIGQLRWRRTSPMPRIGQLSNGYQFWQEVEDKGKGFNIAWTRTILINSCTFEQFEDIQEMMLLILHCQTMYCYQKVLPSIFITSETKKLRTIVSHSRTSSTIGTTRATPRNPSTSRTSPSCLSRQVAPSRITLAWRPAEWRKPPHHNSHIQWLDEKQTAASLLRLFDYHGWAIYTDDGNRVVDGETVAGWWVISRSLRWQIYVMFRSGHHHRGPPGLFWCQNTLQQHRWIDCHDWSIGFLGSSRSCHSWWTVMFFLWFHACCWYLVWARSSRTHVQLALACQQSMIRVQHRLRFTMQHVYGHSGNL